MAASEAFYAAAERRVEYWTLSLGAAASLVVAISWGWRQASGVAAGALLAWVNYRWLKQGVATLAKVSTTQAEAHNPRIPKRVYLKFFGRYALLVPVLYVIFSRSLLPAAAVLAGLFTLVAGVVAEMVYGLVRGQEQPNSD